MVYFLPFDHPPSIWGAQYHSRAQAEGPPLPDSYLLCRENVPSCAWSLTLSGSWGWEQNQALLPVGLYPAVKIVFLT